jgi:hypothetical protein
MTPQEKEELRKLAAKIAREFGLSQKEALARAKAAREVRKWRKNHDRIMKNKKN